jgi:NADH-ubiquinone oxidoreductase chain 4L
MTLGLCLFIVGVLGFIINRSNIIMIIISIELILLACTLHLLQSAEAYDDIIGQTYAVMIISLAGAESAVGLGLVVAYYRLRGTLTI